MSAPDEAGTNWRVGYDVDPILVRDPVAEALGVLGPGEPFAVSYADVVQAAGHSCPTAAGAFRVAQVGLDALYPDARPVRGDVRVTVGGPADAAPYGVMGSLLSYVTGAAGDDGFAGLPGGVGDRRDRLAFESTPGDEPVFVFERTDTGEAVTVTYHLDRLASPGPVARRAGAVARAVGAPHPKEIVGKLLVGAATAAESGGFGGRLARPVRDRLLEAWHDRVRVVLTDDDLFSVAAASG
ncbi:hypothetical protein ACFQH6_02980 [Halobacteriaceae archaeon GCM10025711]